jgi:hypothetical protein
MIALANEAAHQHGHDPEMPNGTDHVKEFAITQKTRAQGVEAP